MIFGLKYLNNSEREAKTNIEMMIMQIYLSIEHKTVDISTGIPSTN
jgi:hypothetical protein